MSHVQTQVVKMAAAAHDGAWPVARIGAANRL
jgi:hypothetical protein